jgi:hypothetical protein
MKWNRDCLESIAKIGDNRRDDGKYFFENTRVGGAVLTR